MTADNDISIQLAQVQGKLGVLAEQIINLKEQTAVGDRMTAQNAELLKPRLERLDERFNELQIVIRDFREATRDERVIISKEIENARYESARQITVVRQDLERQIGETNLDVKALNKDIVDLRLNWAKLSGVGAVIGMISGVAGGFIVRLVVGG